MGQEEVQYQLNDAEKLEIYPVDILSYYWRPVDGVLMLKTTGLYKLSDETMDDDMFRVDYTDDLALFILKTRIGLKKTQENRNSWVTKEWREWAVKFINGKKECMARLVRIFGKDLLEYIFGSQVTIAMLRPLSFHKLWLARLKKPGGKDRRSPNNSGLKYGIRVSRNAKEAIQFDRENGNSL